MSAYLLSDLRFLRTRTEQHEGKGFVRLTHCSISRDSIYANLSVDKSIKSKVRIVLPLLQRQRVTVPESGDPGTQLTALKWDSLWSGSVAKSPCLYPNSTRVRFPSPAVEEANQTSQTAPYLHIYHGWSERIFIHRHTIIS